MKNICVYASSSKKLDEKYYKVAFELGSELGKRGYDLVFGGGQVGLMGKCAEGFHFQNRKVTSIIPEFLKIPGVYYEKSDEYYVTEDLRGRKKIMEDLSSGFIALPGGFGTYEELIEVITLKQLGRHNKPIIVLNVEGFYDKLLDIFHDLIEKDFVSEKYAEICYFANSIEEVLKYLENYSEKKITPKWQDVSKKNSEGDNNA